MRVYYDHQIFCEQSFGGISRYYYELIKGAQQNELFTPILDVKFAENVFSQLLKPDNRWLTRARFKGRKDLVRLINHVNTFYQVRNTEFDIFHPTYFHQSALKNRMGKPMFITVLDMIDEKYHANLLQFKKLIQHRKKMIHGADHIIAISENTRQDIITHFNINPNKVTTIHLASSLDATAIAACPKSTDTPPYVLFIGSRKGVHKNFDNYLKALRIMAQEMKEMCFVFGGGGLFTETETAAIAQVGLSDRIIYEPIRNDEDIIRLYKNASLLIYPSLYEGFGLPLVEAFSCGVPCATAKGSCLEEVGGNAARYFDPLDPADIASVAVNLLNNPDGSKELVSKGFERALMFTWKNTVIQTNALYRKFLGS
jgi:glycosyltransferase involved in cell wall biosynthesis